MKNIVLLGAPRSGKSTFSRILLNNFCNYNIIQGDIIRQLYSFIQYNNPVSMKGSTATVVINNEDIKNMIRYFFESSIECEPDLRFILETCDLKIKDARKYARKGYIVIAFGYPDITVEQGVENLEKYDTIKD